MKSTVTEIINSLVRFSSGFNKWKKKQSANSKDKSIEIIQSEKEKEK
jgi:hypothetical protein